MAVIAIDNGHGFNTAGKRTPPFPGTGKVIREWEFNHPTARFLKTELEVLGHTVIMVSDTSDDTPLATRVNKANGMKVDLFISIHYNALNAVWGNHGGIETWYSTGSVKGKDLADKVQTALINKTKLRNRGIKEGAFYVLKNTTSPAILIECGFMDNLEEAKLMLDANYQINVARAITEGVQEFLGIDKPKSSPIKSEVSEWAREAMEWGVKNNLTDGSNPKDPISLERLITILYRSKK